MTDKRLTNYIRHLTKANEQASLIEISGKDLSHLAASPREAFAALCDVGAAVFDAKEKLDRTNVLVIDEPNDEGCVSLFGAVLEGIEGEIEGLQKRQLLSKLAGLGFGQAVGGSLGGAAGDGVAIGTDKIMEYAAEWMGSATELMASAADTVTNVVADQAGQVLEAVGESGADAISRQWSSSANLSLTVAARGVFQDSWHCFSV